MAPTEVPECIFLLGLAGEAGQREGGGLGTGHVLPAGIHPFRLSGQHTHVQDQLERAWVLVLIAGNSAIQVTPGER